MGYSRNVLAGFGWQTILKIVGNGLTLLKIVILTRLLTPEDFGLFSLVTIALGVLESATQTGVNTTILQAKQSVEYFIDTAWVIAIIRGLIIGCLMIVMGVVMSQFYSQPQLVFLVGIAALVPFIKGFINPAIVSLHKELNFSADTAYRFALLVAETVFSIVFVWFTRSVYLWILALVAAALFEVVISFVFFKLKPHFVYLSSRAQLIFNNAKGLGLLSVLNYLTENIDNVLIGKLIGSYGLGIYQPTYALGHEPNYEVTKSINHGALPVYIKIEHEPGRLKRAFLKTLFTTMPLTIALSLPLLLFPELIVKLLFGDQWLTAIPLLRWLVIAGLVQGFLNLGYSLFIARQKYALMNLQLSCTFVLLVGLLLWLSPRYGLTGAVIAVLLSRVLPLPITLFNINRELSAAPERRRYA